MKKKRLLIVINSLLIILLIGLIFLIKRGVVTNFDLTIYHFVTSNLNPNLTFFFKVITFLGSTIFMIAITLIFLLFWRQKGRGKQFLIIIILAILLSNFLKLAIARERPDVLKLVIENTYSFPSGHTIAITTLSGFLIYVLWQEWGSLGWILKCLITSFITIIALLVMISRIYLGAHFATDILGGIICSLLVLNTTIPLLEKNK